MVFKRRSSHTNITTSTVWCSKVDPLHRNIHFDRLYSRVGQATLNCVLTVFDLNIYQIYVHDFPLSKNFSVPLQFDTKTESRPLIISSTSSANSFMFHPFTDNVTVILTEKAFDEPNHYYSLENIDAKGVREIERYFEGGPKAWHIEVRSLFISYLVQQIQQNHFLSTEGKFSIIFNPNWRFEPQNWPLLINALGDKFWLITARIGRMGEVIVSLCLSVHTLGGGGGYLPWPGPDRGSLPWPGPNKWVPTLTGGYLPWPSPDWGYLPWPGGTYPGAGTPKVGTPRQGTCYTAGSMPLAFTQEDFLVCNVLTF